jgi:hypothetical protein
MLASVGALGAAGTGIGALAVPGSVSAATRPPPRALVRDLVCRQGPRIQDRSAAITAVMRPVSGTQHMRMRFSLLAMLGARRAFHPLRGGVLGLWIAPRHDPNLGQNAGDRWIVKEPVIDLLPGAYRFRVQFRWLGSDGQVLASAVRWSRVCRESA